MTRKHKLSKIFGFSLGEVNGFTFIEILVVVTIIGVIAAIGVVSYSEFLKQSRDAKRKGDLEQIRAALEMYKSYNNSYPSAAAGDSVPASICDPGGCATATYLSKTPADPKPSQYKYYYSTTGTSYTLGAYLEQPGSSTCGDCDQVGAQACNYCMGPYGQL